MAFYSATLLGVQPLPVEIEIDLSPGLPFFQIVGLPDAILRESKVRVKSAILQSGFEFPYDERVVLNLAPSKVKKEGSGFELGLAMRILCSSGQVPFPDKNILFLGELALDGTVRGVPEVAALTFAAHKQYSGAANLDLMVVPRGCLREVGHVGVPVVEVGHLNELRGQTWWDGAQLLNEAEGVSQKKRWENKAEIEDFKFSDFWARHLLIAAIGGHHYLLCGPPGCGKTFFAESLRALLASLRRENEVENRLLNSIFNREADAFPWAAPHHSASIAGLIGGGSPPKPGAVTRAHGGILFLDELLEFKGASLDALREPIERGWVEVFRAGNHISFPSRFQLIGATNPCRCGHWKDLFKGCRCFPHVRQMYQARLSGPFSDRFDVKLMCQVPVVNENRVSGVSLISKARALVAKSQIREWAADARHLLEHQTVSQNLSFRRVEKIKRLVSTLALIDEEKRIMSHHVREACDYQKFLGLDEN